MDNRVYGIRLLLLMMWLGVEPVPTDSKQV